MHAGEECSYLLYMKRLAGKQKCSGEFFSPRNGARHSIAMKGGDAVRYAILGGDLRFVHLVRMLRESGRNAAGFFQETAGGDEIALRELGKYDCILSNWPMRRPLSGRELSDAEVLESIAPGSMMLLCGPKFPGERRWDLQYINLWADEALLQENAWLTAEAAVGTAVARLGCGMAGIRCMVVGYGRIGRALTEILLNTGAQVMVVSGKEGKRRLAEESGAQTAAYEDLRKVLPGRKLVFSTPPAMVMDAETLRFADADAFIVDLASPPYGVDMDAAQALNLHAVREPGLPGRWCPLSAARAIYNAVIRWEEEEKYVGLEK